MKVSNVFTFKGVAAACSIAGLAALSGTASAGQIFTTTGGGVTSATADFTVGSGTLTVVLTDTATVAPSSRADLLSDLSFSISGGSASNASVTGTGNLTTCTSSGCGPGVGSASAWEFGTNSGVGTGSFLLTGLSGHPKTLILGSVNPVCSGNGTSGGLCGLPDARNYFQNSATFTLTIPGISPTSTISNVAFSFGTGPETVLAGTPPLQTAVPIPAAAWLFGSGLMGLVAVARRRKGSGSSLATRELAAA